MNSLFKKILTVSLALFMLIAFFSSCDSNGRDVPIIDDTVDRTMPPKTQSSGTQVHPEDEWTGCISLEDADDKLIIHNPHGDETLQYNYIGLIEYSTGNFEPGMLMDGISNDRIRSGIFLYGGEEYHLHIYNGYQHYITLKYQSEEYIFNLESKEELLEWKNVITEKSSGGFLKDNNN